eukprot:303485-Rhodomonas_salina.2
MSGTDIAAGAGGLLACYAMSGTDIACGVRLTRALPVPVYPPSVSLRACDAMSGTEIAFAATRSTRSTTLSSRARP